MIERKARHCEEEEIRAGVRQGGLEAGPSSQYQRLITQKRRADGRQTGRTEDAEQHHDPRLRLSAGEKVSASRRGKHSDASASSLAAALTFDLVVFTHLSHVFFLYTDS